MASRTQRQIVRAETFARKSAKKRAAAWDQISRPGLAFDFTSSAADQDKASPLSPSDKSRESVKQAIIRWLDEQL